MCVCVTSKEKKEIRQEATVGEEKAESQKILWVFISPLIAPPGIVC